MCMDKVKDWLFGEEEEGYTEEDIRKIWGGNLLRVMTAIQDFPNK